ncbi:hypothetical protein [Pyrinomonas sp.]|uniref:hypothetical protein n=1 Tax=Pyrinomonas sp. TaxID=2080306 RepID=UPI003320FD02
MARTDNISDEEEAEATAREFFCSRRRRRRRARTRRAREGRNDRSLIDGFIALLRTGVR